MKRGLLGMAVMLAFVGSANAQIPVTVTSDIPAWTNQVQTMAEWAKTAKSWAQQAKDTAIQLKAWMQQGLDMKAQYDAITGIRNLGDIWNNQVLRRSVPDDWSGVYDTAGDAMLFGAQAERVAEMRSISAKVRASEQLVGTLESNMGRVEKRASDMAAGNKAVGQAAYARQPGLIKQIESLMLEVNETQDAKAIAELQARIDAEAAAQAWQTNNLILIAQLQDAERDLANQQRISLSQSIIGTKSTAYPSLGELP